MPSRLPSARKSSTAPGLLAQTRAPIKLGNLNSFTGAIAYAAENNLNGMNLFFDSVGSLPVIGDMLAKIDFIQYQFLLYGLALVAMMLLRPEGLFPSQRRKRELHATEDLAGEDELGASPEHVEDSA